MKNVLLVSVTALALTACATVGPDHVVPAMEMPAVYAEPAPNGQATAQSAWWRSFGDPRLDTLVEQALAANLDIQTAASRIREARAAERELAARTLPKIDAQASAARSRISENAIPPLPGSGAGPGRGGLFGLPGSEFNQFRIGLDASWEIDLFGAVRRAGESASARTGAAELSAEDARVSLAAGVAAAYLDLRALQRREAVARAEAARLRGLAGIAASRAEAGLTSEREPDVRRAAAEQAEAAIAPLRAQARVRIHALGVLTGRPPEALIGELSTPIDTPLAAPAPPPGLPSELLRRRPDIRAAERRVAAASADIGVTTAELYPRISLTAQPALVATELTDLTRWGSRAYSLSAGLLWPLFDGGRIRARIAQADERHAQALIAYRKAVLIALRDVEDALARLAADRDRRDHANSALTAARKARAVADDRARAGLVNRSDPLDAEAAVRQGEDALIQAEAAVAQDTVALFKALGGGWQGADAPGRR